MRARRDARGRAAAPITAGALLLAALGLVPSSASAQTLGGAQAASTNRDIVQTIPITRRAEGHRAVVMSVGPANLPALASGATLRASAELHVSTTCVAPDPRCIGRIYSFNPIFSAQIVLADSPRATSGVGTLPLTPRVEHNCGQRRPNRNHHCVLTLPETATPIADPAQLPCPPGGCYLNLVTDAHNRHAKHGNKLVIGNDQPDGTVHGGRGQLNAVVVPPGQELLAQTLSTGSPATSEIPVGTRHSGFQTVVYSQELDGLRAGDVITANALQWTGVGTFSLPLFVGTELILTGRPDRTDPATHFATGDARLDPANGFNCTHDRSPYHNPCKSRKVGVVTITHDAFDRFGEPKPLYVNLIARAYPKVAQGTVDVPGTVFVRPGGYLSVTRYPAPAG
jgi:hypothetical protein